MINLLALPRLQHLDCTGNQIPHLDIRSLTELERLGYDLGITEITARPDQESLLVEAAAGEPGPRD